MSSGQMEMMAFITRRNEMGFNEWWDNLPTREQNSMDLNGAASAWEFGQLEAAEHILELWNEPWPIRQKSFITMLREYVESLK